MGYTGPESFVSSLIAVNALSWFPRHQAMSLQLSPQTDDRFDSMALYQKCCEMLNSFNGVMDQLGDLQLRGRTKTTSTASFNYQIIDSSHAENTESILARKGSPLYRRIRECESGIDPRESSDLIIESP